MAPLQTSVPSPLHPLDGLVSLCVAQQTSPELPRLMWPSNLSPDSLNATLVGLGLVGCHMGTLQSFDFLFVVGPFRAAFLCGALVFKHPTFLNAAQLGPFILVVWLTVFHAVCMHHVG